MEHRRRRVGPVWSAPSVARHNFEQFSGEALDLRLLHRWNRLTIGADGERGFVWPAVRATSFRVPTKGNELAGATENFEGMELA